MKKLLLSCALIGGFGSQVAASTPAVAPAPVISGINIGAYTKPWDMVRDLLTKHPRREAMKQMKFPKKSLIIPGVVALVAMVGAKVVEYVWNEYDIWGYKRNFPYTDRDGYDKDGLYHEVSGHYTNRDHDAVGKHLSDADRKDYASIFTKNERSSVDPATTWQKVRWAVGSRARNPWNWGILPATGAVAGLLALTPTFWKLGKAYSAAFAAEQEKQIDRIVDVWKDAKHFFPEELHNAFDTLVELKKKDAKVYEASRTRVLALMLQGCSSICPVI